MEHNGTELQAMTYNGQEVNSWLHNGVEIFKNIISLIPTMTSNTAPLGTCTSSGGNGTEPYLAFDGNSNTYWASTEIVDKWIRYDFNSKVKLKKVEVTMMHQGTNLNFRIYTIDGSGNGKEVVYEQIATTANAYFTKTFEFPESVEIYGIRISGNSDSYYRFCVKEVKCYGQTL